MTPIQEVIKLGAQEGRQGGQHLVKHADVKAGRQVSGRDAGT
jgi:hypothetical protein